jgi:hypothetical protein
LPKPASVNGRPRSFTRNARSPHDDASITERSGKTKVFGLRLRPLCCVKVSLPGLLLFPESNDVGSTLACEQQQRESKLRFRTDWVTLFKLTNFIQRPRMITGRACVNVRHLARCIEWRKPLLHAELEDLPDGLHARIGRLGKFAIAQYLDGVLCHLRQGQVPEVLQRSGLDWFLLGRFND